MREGLYLLLLLLLAFAAPVVLLSPARRVPLPVEIESRAPSLARHAGERASTGKRDARRMVFSPLQGSRDALRMVFSPLQGARDASYMVFSPLQGARDAPRR